LRRASMLAPRAYAASAMSSSREAWMALVIEAGIGIWEWGKSRDWGFGIGKSREMEACDYAIQSAPIPPFLASSESRIPNSESRLLRQRHPLEQRRDHAVRADALGLGFVTEQDAVAQDVGRDRVDVLGGHVVAPGEPRMRACATVERDGAARARAVGDPAREFGTVRRRVARRERELDQVFLQLRRKMRLQHFRTRGEHVRLAHEAPRWWRRGKRLVRLFAREGKDRGFGERVRIIDAHMQQETVELR